MPNFTITVDSDDVKIITKIANKTGVSGRALIESQISGWAKGQIEGFFMDKIRGKTTSELIALLGEIQ